MPVNRKQRLLFAGGFGALAAFFLVWAWKFGTANPGAEGLTASALYTSMAALCLAAAGALCRRQSVTDALGLEAGRISWIQLGVVALGTVGLSHLCGELLRETALWDQGILQRLEETLSGLGIPEMAFAAVGFVLAPAIGEELLFRGLLLRGLLPRLGPTLAIVISSMLFGALHVDPGQALATTVLGIYLGLLAFLSGSTRGPIFCHLVNNGVALASIGMANPAPGTQESSPEGWTLAFAAVATAAGTWTLVQMRRTATERDELPG